MAQPLGAVAKKHTNPFRPAPLLARRLRQAQTPSVADRFYGKKTKAAPKALNSKLNLLAAEACSRRLKKALGMRRASAQRNPWTRRELKTPTILDGSLALAPSFWSVSDLHGDGAEARFR